ncbi:DUF4382 domain-containing protein [Ectothiorhodospiraceae bacterium WFHF3C12]|nr:DUF4382 domain-containing protein [Ectothiorhodospiraceae bacterium WFHF3C12]
MPTKIRSIVLLSAVLLSAAMLGGCGGTTSTSDSGGGDSDTTTTMSTQGSVALFLTDAPADPDAFSAVNVRLTRVELIPEDDGDPVLVREDSPITVDLLDLTHEAIPLSYREGVPEGEYCAITLTVESLELVLTAGGTAEPELPAGGTLTLRPEDCFTVEADGVSHVQVDLDVGRSIEVEDGEYSLRPVFYVDIIRDGDESRLVRMDGEIADYDEAAQRVLLCGSMPILRADHDGAYAGCAWIQVTPETGFFDNVNHGGTPRALAEIFDPANIGQSTTVAGVVEGFGHGYLDLDVPPGHFPPPGECKLWHPQRPAGQQPPPEPCESLMETAPTDTVVIDHDGRILLDRRGLVNVDAVAVELGSFLRVDGDVADPVIDDMFTMDVHPGEPVDASEPLPVQLQPAPAGGNGTRLVSKSGVPLVAGDLDSGESVSVDGILATSPDLTYLRSALVIVDDTLASLERLSGTVLSFDDTSATVATATAEDNPCADAPGDVLVKLDDETSYLTVTITDTDSTTSAGGELAADQRVDIYGECTVGGTFHASQVVIIDDERTP